MVEVLILHGSPASGKSTLSKAVAGRLREADMAHAVIDLDDLSKIYPDPDPGHPFALDNLKAIWPNYAAIPSVRVIVPAVVTDEKQLGQFRAAMPAEKLVVCELVVPKVVLRDRINARGYNEYWLKRLQGFVDLYHSRTDLDRIRDFQVATHDRSIDETSQEIIEKAGWQSPAFPSG